jgi:general secretion pathway protein I
MFALAIIGVGLVVLIEHVANNMFAAQDAQMMGVTTDLARGKMYDVEEQLLKDGFMDTDQSDKGTFDAEGWPSISWESKVEEVELPSWEDLQALAQGRATKAQAQAQAQGSGALGSGALGSGSADFSQLGSGALDQFQNSALGGMLGQFGGFGGAGGGSDIASSQGALMIQSQYTMVQETLKVSIRKVTVTVRWQVLGRDRDLPVVAYFTDAAAMDKVLQGLGSQEINDDGTGSGSGSGSGSRTGTGTGSGARLPTSNQGQGSAKR